MSNFLQILRICFKDKYLVTGGRASRKEFWTLAIVVGLLALALWQIDSYPYIQSVAHVINYLLFIPLYTCLVRRLHDTNRSPRHILPVLAGVLTVLFGFFYQNVLVINVGEVISGLALIYLIVLCLLKGQAEDNQYGQVPTL